MKFNRNNQQQRTSSQEPARSASLCSMFTPPALWNVYPVEWKAYPSGAKPIPPG